MPTEQDVVHDVGWRPGPLGRIRAVARRTLRAFVGARAEQMLHGWYHRVLRAMGRFGPPEDVVSKAMLGAIAARSMTIIDIGANVGRYSWFLRRHAPRQSRLFALEPHPGAARLLRKAMAGLPGTNVLELGASDVDGMAQLMVPDGSSGNPVSGLAWVKIGGGTAEADRPLIRIRRLDGLIREGSITINGPVLLKIDVEGGEPRVLRGAADLLRDLRPILYFECQASSLARQGETPEGVWDELRSAGYRMYGNRAGRFVPTSTVDASIVNYLAIPDLSEPEPLDGTTMDAILGVWAARTSRR
jgi:FkbM family methyltransferase